MNNKSPSMRPALSVTASSRSKGWHKRKRTFRKWAKYAILCRSGLRLINIEKNFRRDKNHFKKNTGWFYMEDVLKIDSEISWTVAKYISSNLVHWFLKYFLSSKSAPSQIIEKAESKKHNWIFHIFFLSYFQVDICFTRFLLSVWICSWSMLLGKNLYLPKIIVFHV